MIIDRWSKRDKRMHYAVRIYRMDDDGKRQRIMVGTYTNRKEAERAEARALDQRDRGTFLAPDTTTVAQLLAEWLAMKRGEVSGNTWADYEITIRRHLVPAFGSIKLQTFRPGPIKAQYVKWQNAGVSTHTIKHCHLRLRAALDYAVTTQLISQNPVRSIRPPKIERHGFNNWNIEQARAFLSAVDGYDEAMQPTRYRIMPSCFWSLLLREGMRRGEALGLRWQDVDWKRGTVSIRQTVTIHKHPRKEIAPPDDDRTPWQINQRAKTKAGERSVRLAPETLQALRDRQVQWRLEKIASQDWQETDLIVSTADGAPINPNNVERSFGAILDWYAAQPDAIEIPRIRIHELRHTCASILLLEGVPAKVVSEKLGHASVSITLDRYSAILPDLQQSAVDAMSRALG